MDPIHVPTPWDDTALLSFEQFCTLIDTPQRTVRDWRRRGTGPTWNRLNGTGRLYTTVGETRRWLGIATSPAAPHQLSGVTQVATTSPVLQGRP